MYLSSLLLVSLVLVAPADSAVQSTPAAQAGAMVAAVDSRPSLNFAQQAFDGAPPSPQAFEVTPTATNDNAVLAPSDDHVCYKIRAFIFKRDDDHAPQFVRSTTCPPVHARVKDAAWPKAMPTRAK